MLFGQDPAIVLCFSDILHLVLLHLLHSDYNDNGNNYQTCWYMCMVNHPLCVCSAVLINAEISVLDVSAKQYVSGMIN